MTRAQAMGLAGGSVVVGGGLLAFLVFTVPPQMPGGEPNTAALIMALISVMLLAGGLGALAATALHNRWPGLAGADRQESPEPGVAIRQGALLSLVVGIILTLAYFRTLDAAFFLVTFLLIGLFEAFVQSRA
jgi:hypothetical protein